ncbi:MAG: peptidylprolyl isomerase [Acidobacteria bacterium]|nr:peptidylprolyl isomerase [Acidobacteriota bacterium]
MKRFFHATLQASLVAALLLLGACHSAKESQESQPSEQTQQSQPAQPIPSSQPSPAGASLLQPASLNAAAPATYRAKFVTTKGDFVIEVTRAWAPNGADRFYNLVKNGFYNGASFFRVLPGFIVQFGISAKPGISAVWHSATIPDDPVRQSNSPGTVTFATAGPNTRTTQVFINLGDNKGLDSQGFAPFGKVVEGMDVVEKFYSGYGEGSPMGNGPDQQRIEKEGRAYLTASFPKLDSIKSASIM